MLPKTSAYVKRYDGQTKWMFFLIEDRESSQVSQVHVITRTFKHYMQYMLNYSSLIGCNRLRRENVSVSILYLFS